MFLGGGKFRALSAITQREIIMGEMVKNFHFLFRLIQIQLFEFEESFSCFVVSPRWKRRINLKKPVILLTTADDDDGDNAGERECKKAWRKIVHIFTEIFWRERTRKKWKFIPRQNEYHQFARFTFKWTSSTGRRASLRTFFRRTKENENKKYERAKNKVGKLKTMRLCKLGKW